MGKTEKKIQKNLEIKKNFYIFAKTKELFKTFNYLLENT